MSREIKFRLRDRETRKIIGYEKEGGSGHWEHKQLSYNEPDTWFEGTVDNRSGIIREQFTGVMAINNKEIYEGDLVKWGHLNESSREIPHRLAAVVIDPDIQFINHDGYVFHWGTFAYARTASKDLEVVS